MTHWGKAWGDLRAPMTRCQPVLLLATVAVLTLPSLALPTAFQLSPPCLVTSLLLQPIIMWSFIIGGMGLAMPIVVPPIREAMGYGNQPTPKAPPPVSKVPRAGGMDGHGWAGQRRQG